MNLDDLQPAPWNPREISDAALSGLKTSLVQFGDISGFVWNSRSGRLVAGHQRLRALKEKFGDALTVENDCLVAGKEIFPIRVVDWDERTEIAANLSANNPHIAGEFTDGLQDILAGLKLELPEFAELNLDALVKTLAAPPEAPEEFAEYDEDIKTDYKCPKCGYAWSGKTE